MFQEDRARRALCISHVPCITQQSRRLQIIACTYVNSKALDALQSHSHRACRARCILSAISCTVAFETSVRVRFSPLCHSAAPTPRRRGARQGPGRSLRGLATVVLTSLKRGAPKAPSRLGRWAVRRFVWDVRRGRPRWLRVAARTYHPKGGFVPFVFTLKCADVPARDGVA